MYDEQQLLKAIRNEIKRQYGTQKAFAKAVGISYTTINSIVSNSAEISTSFSNIIRICEKLGIILDKFYGCTEDEIEAKLLYEKYKSNPDVQEAVRKLLDM